jgi:hypothetical protein
MEDEDEVVNLQLGIDEALVLFEMLAGFSIQPALEIPSPAERLTLLRLHESLENELLEPFQPDYKEKVDAARKRLLEQFSGK